MRRLSLALLLVAMAGGAHAQSVIGEAAQAAPQVTGTLGAKRVVITAGARVHQNETVQTSPEGRATLSFEDSTRLAIGPSASVRLDKFVFNRDATARDAVMNMTRGAFRFATGVSDPRAFRLQTPHAVVGIRGTIVEFDVASTASRITLQQGAIQVCARAGRRDCVNLTSSGQTVTVRYTGDIVFAGGFTGPDLTRDSPGGGVGGDSGGRGGNQR